MSIGFFTFAQGAEYHRMAYALALSLKLSQHKYNKLSIAVTPGERVAHKYREVFDQVIEIPLGDAARESTWKLENEWKAPHITPYDETIKVDADMLFFSDITYWIHSLSYSVMAFTTEVRTYRGEVITSDFHRKVFTANDLPNVYSALCYFKKWDATFEFFDTVRAITENTMEYFDRFLEPEHRPSFFSTDVAYGIAAKIHDSLELQAHTASAMPTFVHLKTPLQGFNKLGDEDWVSHLPIDFTPNFECLIGNHRQNEPLHYYRKNFLTDEMIQIMERKLGIA